MARTIFFVGDLHLGRRPSGLAEALEPLGLSPAALAPQVALERTVSRAIDEGARAVIFAGDLVDDADDRFEAFAPLERAVRALGEASIAVFGVAGNHDQLALPRLARRIPEFTLLGEGGRWALVPLPETGDDPPVDLLGWSFPRQHVRDDPTLDPSLAQALEGRRPGATLLGVIHGDLDRPSSRYAPLDGGRLLEIGADLFALGHIHAPQGSQRIDSSKGIGQIGYLGSLCALDPGEPGAHGPFRLGPGPGERGEAGAARLLQLPLSPLRFEAIGIELDEVQAQSPDTILEAIGAVANEALGSLDEGDDLLFLALRCTLRGQLRDRGAVRALSNLAVAERALRVGAVPAVIETVIDRTRPAVDLQALAEAPTPVGHLARRILDLEAGEAKDLVATARETIAPYRSGRWEHATHEREGADALDPPLDARLLAAAIDALDTLLEVSRRGDARRDRDT